MSEITDDFIFNLELCHKNLKKYILYICNKTTEYYKLFLHDIFVSIEHFATNDKLYIDKLCELKSIINNLSLVDKEYDLDDYLSIDFSDNKSAYDKFHQQFKSLKKMYKIIKILLKETFQVKIFYYHGSL
jgi:hypothetical protein